MRTRPLKRSDLPTEMSPGHYLNIPVVYKGKERLIADVPNLYTNPHIVYLKDNNGKPVNIKDLKLIIKYKKKPLPKKDRFKRIASKRITKVLDALESFGKCSHREFYDYSPTQIENLFFAIDVKVRNIKKYFKKGTTKTNRFKF